jgi:SAM-dependent methyltransferase
LAFGASKEFLDRSGLDIRQGGMEAIPAEDNSFDRVFCISVIEHLDKETALMGMVEMGRILRPGGRLIMTVDVSVDHTLNEVDPLAMLWHSGLVPVGRLDLAWPKARFGYGYKENSSLDVFGLVLTKLEEPVYQQYGESEGQMIHRHRISSIRRPQSQDAQPRRRWKRVLDAALGRDVGSR